jgi:hypothetical protein
MTTKDDAKIASTTQINSAPSLATAAVVRKFQFEFMVVFGNHTTLLVNIAIVKKQRHYSSVSQCCCK